MIYLKFGHKVSETKYYIETVHYMPFDPVDGLGMTQEELEENGILVDSLPNPPQMPEGKAAILFANPSTKQITYEQVDIEISESLEKQVSEIKAQNAEIIYNLVLNGLM